MTKKLVNLQQLIMRSIYNQIKQDQDEDFK